MALTCKNCNSPLMVNYPSGVCKCPSCEAEYLLKDADDEYSKYSALLDKLKAHEATLKKDDLSNKEINTVLFDLKNILPECKKDIAPDTSEALERMCDDAMKYCRRYLKYNTGKNQLMNCEYEKANETFKSIIEFKNSRELAEECEENLKTDLPESSLLHAYFAVQVFIGIMLFFKVLLGMGTYISLFIAFIIAFADFWAMRSKGALSLIPIIISVMFPIPIVTVLLIWLIFKVTLRTAVLTSIIITVAAVLLFCLGIAIWGRGK